jgi:hypothetical protein
MNISDKDPIFLAVKLAQERGLLPTDLGSADLQLLTQRLKERVFFSARTANLIYLDALKKLVDRHVQGEGRDNDLAKLRLEAKQMLQRLGYTPEGGFPDDKGKPVPPARAGSLQDLGSDKRLNLIFDTQAALARGLGMKLRNLQRQEQYPAVELVRYKDARQPDWRRDWEKRWQIAGENVEWQGALHDQMIALQTSPIWAALGSSALFPDALNVDYPPFAFNSGMGWHYIKAKEAEQLGLISAPATAEPLTETQVMVRDYLKRQFGPLGAAMRPAGPTVSDADQAKLARLDKLRAKFDAITAKRGY